MEKTFAGKTIQDIVYDYSDMLIRIAFQNTKSMVNAEDMVQDVLIKLMNHSGGFENKEHVKAWLIRVLINRCKDFQRSAWMKRMVPFREDLDVLAPQHQEVMEEIFQLKPEDRNIIYLFYYEGYAIREIAQMIGMKENTVSSRLTRARKKLKVLLVEGGMGA